MASESREILVPVKLVILVVITMIGYLFPAIWFASQLSTRVGSLESGSTTRTLYMEHMMKRMIDTEGDVAGLKMEIKGLKSALKRIDKNMQKIADNIYEVKR